MEAWLTDVLGIGQPSWSHSQRDLIWPEGVNWAIHQIFGRTTFIFKNPEDLTAFTLKWA